MFFKKQGVRRTNWLVSNLIEQRQKYKKGLEIKNYFLGINRHNIDREILEIIEYFENNQFSAFPYNFTKNYSLIHALKIKVYLDESSKMKYVLHENKRLYFPKTWNSMQIRHYYNTLLREQEVDSPQRYETPAYNGKNGDVIADIGAAEGIWALARADSAAKIYLFECGEEWISALEKTFAPWKEKVVIVNKYISNVTNEVIDGVGGGYASITLDDFVNGGKINFIKADIEGMQLKLLQGGIKTITEADDLKLLLCTYHRNNDADDLRAFLEEKGFITEYSKGYMILFWDKTLKAPYLRRGLIRASKPGP
jgi:hypothetical protein